MAVARDGHFGLTDLFTGSGLGVGDGAGRRFSRAFIRRSGCGFRGDGPAFVVAGVLVLELGDEFPIGESDVDDVFLVNGDDEGGAGVSGAGVDSDGIADVNRESWCGSRDGIGVGVVGLRVFRKRHGKGLL